MRPLVIGFDLDQTLADSADGIVATWLAIGREHGFDWDPARLHREVGLPLGLVLGERLPPGAVASAIARYRELYPTLGIAVSTRLPGAAEALTAVRERGGRTLVVSAKRTDVAQALLERIGLAPDEVVGDLFAEAKGVALVEHGATIYVGDHLGDIAAARAAGATAVAVATGPYSAEELTAGGADVVLADLTHFPGWLAEELRVRLAQPGAGSVNLHPAADSL